ncbi:hypothetical protein FI667_g3643, partial [Globisporangium splendens]
MRHLRTILAVDTICCFLQRYEKETVLRAISGAVRQIFDHYARVHSIEPLLRAPVVVTSTNITRLLLNISFVLVVRITSSALAVESAAGTESKQSSRRVAATSKSSLRNGASGRGSSTHGGSPCTRSGMTSMSPQRRSILASEGTHVLLQERIGAFQHRGTSGNGLALFKVNREDAATTDAAAKRRQRSIAYGNECKRTYLN